MKKIVILLFLLISNNYLHGLSLEATFSITNISGNLVPIQKGISNSMLYPDFTKHGGREIISLTTWKKDRTATFDDSKTLAQRTLSAIGDLETESVNRYRTNFNDGSWSSIAIPQVEDIMCTYENTSGPENYQDGVWYRHRFVLTSSYQGKKNITLIFLGANYITDVWLNNRYIGYHEGGYTPFTFDISDYVKYSGTNVLAVRIDNIPRGSADAKNNVIIPYKISDWFNYTGLLREVYLVVQNKIHTVRADIKTLDNSGNVDVGIVLRNFKTKSINTSGQIEIFRADFLGNNLSKTSLDDTVLSGGAVAQRLFSLTLNSNTIKYQKEIMNISGGAYWSPTQPNLYIARITLTTNGTVVDRYYTQFGLRKLSIANSQVLLNGEVSPFLAGAARHEDHPDVGAALGTDIILNDLQVIKNTLKCNYLRTGHYPNHPMTYSYADRLGLVTYCEIPIYWFDRDEFTAQVITRKIGKQMYREMMYANFNSPSIWFWGTLNEGSSTDERRNFIIDLYDDAYAIDGTRFVMQAAVGADVYDATHNACDMVGVNMYYGVFTNYSPLGNYYQPTKNALEKLHQTFPTKPILVTEYGYWSQEPGGSEAKQVNVFQDTFKAFKEKATRDSNGNINGNGYVIGATWWCAFNWYSPFTGLQSMGLLHMDRITTKQVTSYVANEYKNYSISETNFAYQETLANVMAYPNPYVEGRSSINYIVFRNLTQNTIIRIYDINESLIKEIKQENNDGYVKWSFDDFQGNKVKPGIYIYYALDTKLKQGKSGKIMVIR